MFSIATSLSVSLCLSSPILNGLFVRAASGADVVKPAPPQVIHNRQTDLIACDPVWAFLQERCQLVSCLL
jgi:hypothetical protein